MRKSTYYMVIILLVILIPVSRAAADSTEEMTQEEYSEQPSVEGTMEEPVAEPSVQEEYTEEYSSEEYTVEEYTTEEYTQEYSEEWTEEPYQSYQQPEPSTEETFEQTVEQYTEEVTEQPIVVPTEEPSIEPSVEPEPVQEPVDVSINQMEVTEFSIEGEVVSEGKGMEGVAVSLTGGMEAEVMTDAEGQFSFTEVPAGDYTIESGVPDGYELEENSRTLTLEDKSKKGITFDLSAIPEESEEETEESIETIAPDERVSADQNVDDSSMNMMLIVIGSALLVLGLLIFMIRALRNR
ncbi:carboxypeptidase regulatory-like domain-containing protein [Salinicoccus sp. ID82-1]|uniref:carboxypeptidase-like regulatory domain-containing protein n=1 Tax=Salinicoccus sp. ID82-1 TaxID=2820269 RepID=UPI001F224326|nr:carboxypeptidase-like regulatory domain-containing protein [Salinicoccus sp. ID82-1]MCG1010619.1 carboxypeptidase regulatory-like domain-containing protein [Salinicoccus sp. ID82-1]